MIDYSKVQSAIRDSLAGTEDNPNLIKVEGVMRTFGLDSTKLEKHRPDVVDWLSQLDDSFMRSRGGGMSLMNMVADKEGSLWAEQYGADELFVLASGLGLAEYLLPRDMWAILPGSMPYIVVNDEKF